jgi:hypothetical protein
MNVLFILMISLLEVTNMSGQRNEHARESNSIESFNDFVSRCRDHKLSERVNEYRAKMNTLIKQGRSKPLNKLSSKDGDYFFDLISEITKQGDFESLELLEKDPVLIWKHEFYMAVAFNENIDGANKLLIKWAIENPTMPFLMKYHPNGMYLMIEMAENKNASAEDRVACLHSLAYLPAAAIKFLDRIKALISDQSTYFRINEPRWGSGIPYAKTVGDVAAQLAEGLEKLDDMKLLQDK